MLPVVVQQLGQVYPLLGTHPGAVLVEGHLEVEVGEFVQLWDDIEKVVEHVTYKMGSNIVVVIATSQLLLEA